MVVLSGGSVCAKATTAGGGGWHTLNIWREDPTNEKEEGRVILRDKMAPKRDSLPVCAVG